MKHAFRTLLALAFVCSAAASAARAQTPTPDSLVTQITTGTGNTFARDISGDGRFVVIESNGDLATVPPGQTAATKSPNNADGNREIFLFDYAQRRIFQITDTRSQLVDPNAAAATRFNRENIRVDVSNNRPAISRDGRFIVFSSNGFDPNDDASSPFQFDGNAAGVAERLRADGNQELFIYRIPDVPAADLTSGATPAFVSLRQNAFTRVTNTPASAPPRAGAVSVDPFVADDNRSAQINDDGSRVVFISTRNLPVVGAPAGTNADGSPEVFAFVNGSLYQLTSITAAAFDANPFAFIDNPNISGDTAGTSVVAFISNATDLRAGAGDTNFAAANSDGNVELFVATFNGTAVTSVRQATRTRRAVAQSVVNIFSPGRRLSRSGQFLAFESIATDPRADATATEQNRGLFVYNVTADTFTLVTARAATDEFESVLRFPTFTGNGDRLVWVSDLNLTATGTRVAEGDNTGLNPTRAKQIFSTPLPPASGSVPVSRLTSTPTATTVSTLEPFVSNTQERISFSLAEVEFGGGNSDLANEAFYLLVPAATSVSDTPAASSALAYFTGASRIPVVAPAASPAPSPAPVTGIAPGMIGVVARTAQSPALAPSTSRVCPADGGGCDAASESMRRPPLPIELGGVSLSVRGAAAGLYFVSPDEIQFVVPLGLAAQTGTNTYPVVITIRGEGGAVRTVRSTLQVPAAQPDIFSTTNDAGGRAVVTNVTNPLLSTGTPEPFTVTTTYANAAGQNVTEPTRLRLVLTGVRGVTRTNITVRLVRADNSTTDITSAGDQIPTDPQATDMPGVFTLDFRLPASLAGAGDVRIVVLATAGGATYTSRPAETAPAFRIN
ncbi:MAG TPA: hypothetical protein VK421_16045 [Pyrinomonadaceae bacterium]|nr:hypothetical protein [Pyrinomonadaceae bacterium]